MIGKTISHYKILEKLGEGGMGIVYKAHDTSLDRIVALKFLPHYLTSDKNEKERFYHEARAAAALTHQNIAVIYEISEHDTQLFIVMEYVEGKTLKQIVEHERETLSIKKVLGISIQICEGLSAAHEKGVVHRDIKSDNIMLTSKGQVKIMDFGLAKIKGASKLTKEGSTVGTAAYMSPEQALGEEVDERSDIFSFGVVLYEMLTTHLPFRGEHQAALLYSLLNEEPQPVARYNEKVTQELEHIVSKTLSKEKEDRYQHCDDLLADLRRERKNLEYAKTGYVKSSMVTQQGKVTNIQRKRIHLKIIIPVVVVLLVAAIFFIFNPFNNQKSKNVNVVPKVKSIAVLPFKNLSPDKNDAYFSDGITEDIMIELSHISALRVIARNSVMKYKNSDKSIKQIGNELGVSSILEGSFQKVGNDIRIAAQLIDVNTNAYLWGETYDKKLTQIFAIQSDVSKQIAKTLKAKLTPKEELSIGKKPTENVMAYQYYLKGKEYYYRYTKKDNEYAILLFKKAINLDSNFSSAFARLGECYGQKFQLFGFPDDWNDSTIAISNKAIAIDSNLVQGYLALAFGLGNKGWEKLAFKADKKALELEPNNTSVVNNLGVDYKILGDISNAVYWFQKTIKLDPKNQFGYLNLAETYNYLLYYEIAEKKLKIGLTLQPDFIWAYEVMGKLYFNQGKYKEVIKNYNNIFPSFDYDASEASLIMAMAQINLGNYKDAENLLLKVQGDNWYGKFANLYLAYLDKVNGNGYKIKEVITPLKEKLNNYFLHGDEDSRDAVYMFLIEILEDNKTEAYKWLDKSISFGFRDFKWLLNNPVTKEIRNEKKFREAVQVMEEKVKEQQKILASMEID